LKIQQLIFVFLGIFTISCGDCENQKIGDLPLSDRYRNFINLNSGEQVSFANSDNERITFIVNRFDGVGFLTGRVVGQGIDFEYGDFTCNEFYERQEAYINLDAQSDRTTLSLNVRDFSRDPDVKEEVLEMILSWAIDMPDEQLTGGVVASFDFNANRFQAPRWPDQVFEVLDELTVDDKTYQNVLSAHDQNEASAIYLVEGIGIVGFMRNSVVYTLLE